MIRPNMGFMDFFRTSEPSAVKVAPEKVDKIYKKKRLQAFIAGTLGYALYYVCRLSMGVMKQPLIDAGLLNATQLGIIGACLYWSYAVGKLINGFLADSSNIKRFMATGLIVSATMNLIMGVLGVGALNGTIANTVLFTCFCIFWAINGWSQSMGAPPAIIALSRWFPLKVRGTYYGIFSSSHNIGEGLSFIFVGSIVAAFGWKWGFFGAALEASGQDPADCLMIGNDPVCDVEGAIRAGMDAFYIHSNLSPRPRPELAALPVAGSLPRMDLRALRRLLPDGSAD